jgi:hypothetical protein
MAVPDTSYNNPTLSEQKSGNEMLQRCVSVPAGVRLLLSVSDVG